MMMIVSASQHEFEDVTVEYLDMPGWQTSTAHIRKFNDLPQNAQKYIQKIEELMEVRGEWLVHKFESREHIPGV